MQGRRIYFEGDCAKAAGDDRQQGGRLRSRASIQGGGDRLRRRGQHLPQSQLLRALQNPQSLTFGAEHLALEPLELMLQGLHCRCHVCGLLNTQYCCSATIKRIGSH